MPINALPPKLFESCIILLATRSHLHFATVNKGQQGKVRVEYLPCRKFAYLVVLPASSGSINLVLGRFYYSSAPLMIIELLAMVIFANYAGLNPTPLPFG